MQLTGLEFTNRFTRSLPADPISHNRVRTVSGAAFSRVTPAPVKAPRLLAWSDDAAALLGLCRLQGGDAVDVVAGILAGNTLLPGMDPFAACYGGHQFGHWAGQLGDGRAIALGEVRGIAGDYWELQLKGAGPTPYSRHADGRAVLRSSLREFLCSEAMFHLRVPTTRALCLVLTGETVVRDMFYDGRPEAEPGAIVTRMAPSFLRFGNLELPAFRRDVDLLRQTTDFILRNYYPHLGEPSPDVYLAFFREVTQRTQKMIVDWMRVGFVHGVMNTDNLSVLGLTIDYGPYGWLDDYDPGFTPNTSDTSGRYCYANQPHCAAWNLACLANALVPLVGSAELLTAEIQQFQAQYEAQFFQMMTAKLGLSGSVGQLERPNEALIRDLLGCLTLVETDMTLFYRSLSEIDMTIADRQAGFSDLSPDCFYQQPNEAQQSRWTHWLAEYQQCVLRERLDARSRRDAMNAVNPWFIPRNYLVYQAIEAVQQDNLKPLNRLMEALRQPYVWQSHLADLAVKRPDWARQVAGCSALSCSS